MRRGCVRGYGAVADRAAGRGSAAVKGSSATAVRNVVSATGSREAMAAPTVGVAPVGPGTDAEEDAVIEVAGAVVSGRRAAVRGVVVIAPAAGRRGSAEVDTDMNLSVGFGSGNGGERDGKCSRTEECFPSTHFGAFLTGTLFRLGELERHTVRHERQTLVWSRSDIVSG